jgi:glyoxylase-like metal-dependent hydrolase (beta-lactamase superfamily II)
MVQLEAAPGVHRIEDCHTNWYLVEGDDGLTVVDAGVPRSWDSLLDALRRLSRSLDDIRAVVLTHAHFDHVGFAERARRQLGVPVWVHEDDVPLTRHPWRYDHERPRSLYFATQPKALPIVAGFLRNRAFWPPPVKEVRRYDDDAGVLPVPGAPNVVPTPGHTIGHCALHLADRDVVLAGDAVVMLDPYTARRGPRLVARAATADVERNTRTLDALAATRARLVLTGHGEPWSGGAEAAVAQARAAGAA